MRIPKWFYKSGLNEIGWPTIDHVIVTKNYEGMTEVQSRPYTISQEQLEQIIHICKTFKINFQISGKTNYPNPDTMTFIFWLEEDEKIIKESKLTESIFKEIEK